MIKKNILTSIKNQPVFLEAYAYAKSEGAGDWRFKSAKACEQLLTFVETVYQEKKWNLGFLLNENFFLGMLKYKRDALFQSDFVTMHFPFHLLKKLSEEEVIFWIKYKIDNSRGNAQKISDIYSSAVSYGVSEKHLLYYIYLQTGVLLEQDIIDINNLEELATLHDFFFPSHVVEEIKDLVL